MREELKREIEIENMSLLEFVLDENTSLYYNQDNKLWFFEYVDLEEDGEEYAISFDITKDTLPLKVNEHILTLEEFSIYQEIAREEESELK